MVYTINGEQLTRRKLVTIDGSQVTTQTGIPLMLNIDLPNVATDGKDVRLAKLDGTPIAREIECVDVPNTDSVTIHYPFNTVASTDSQFYVYWGNASLNEPAADSTYGSEAVWGDQRTVLHMNQEPNGAGANTILDSTGNDNHGSQSGFTVNSLEDGDYAKGIHFDNSNDYISLGALSTSTAITLDSVFTLDQINKQHRLISKHFANGGTGASYYMDVTSANEIFVAIYDGGTANSGTLTTSGLGLQADTLYSVSFTVDASKNAEIVVNGVSKITDTLTYQLGTCTANVWIGDLSAGGADLFDGVMFESRITDAGRSSNYMKTSTANLNNPTASGTSQFYKSISIPQHQRRTPQFIN